MKNKIHCIFIIPIFIFIILSSSIFFFYHKYLNHYSTTNTNEIIANNDTKKVNWLEESNLGLTNPPLPEKIDNSRTIYLEAGVSGKIYFVSDLLNTSTWSISASQGAQPNWLQISPETQLGNNDIAGLNFTNPTYIVDSNNNPTSFLFKIQATSTSGETALTDDLFQIVVFDFLDSSEICDIDYGGGYKLNNNKSSSFTTNKPIFSSQYKTGSYKISDNYFIQSLIWYFDGDGSTGNSGISGIFFQRLNIDDTPIPIDDVFKFSCTEYTTDRVNGGIINVSWDTNAIPKDNNGTFSVYVTLTYVNFFDNTITHTAKTIFSFQVGDHKNNTTTIVIIICAIILVLLILIYIYYKVKKDKFNKSLLLDEQEEYKKIKNNISSPIENTPTSNEPSSSNSSTGF